jgi:hypothetical protein
MFDFFNIKIALSCAPDNLGVNKVLGLLEKPLEIADYMFCPENKNKKTLLLDYNRRYLRYIH